MLSSGLGVIIICLVVAILTGQFASVRVVQTLPPIPTAAEYPVAATGTVTYPQGQAIEAFSVTLHGGTTAKEAVVATDRNGQLALQEYGYTPPSVYPISHNVALVGYPGLATLYRYTIVGGKVRITVVATRTRPNASGGTVGIPPFVNSIKLTEDYGQHSPVLSFVFSDAHGRHETIKLAQTAAGVTTFGHTGNLLTAAAGLFDQEVGFTSTTINGTQYLNFSIWTEFGWLEMSTWFDDLGGHAEPQWATISNPLPSTTFGWGNARTSNGQLTVPGGITVKFVSSGPQLTATNLPPTGGFTPYGLYVFAPKSGQAGSYKGNLYSEKG